MSFNPYAYAHADPINLTDPTGYCVDPAPSSNRYRYCIENYIPFAEVRTEVSIGGRKLPGSIPFLTGDNRGPRSDGGTYKQHQDLVRLADGSWKESHIIGFTHLVGTPMGGQGRANRCGNASSNVWCDSILGLPAAQFVAPSIATNLTIREMSDSVRIEGVHTAFPALEIWQYGDPSGPRLLYHYDPQDAGHTPFELQVPVWAANLNSDYIAPLNSAFKAWCESTGIKVDLPVLNPVSVTVADILKPRGSATIVPLYGTGPIRVDTYYRYQSQYRELR